MQSLKINVGKTWPDVTQYNLKSKKVQREVIFRVKGHGRQVDNGIGWEKKLETFTFEFELGSLNNCMKNQI